MLLTLAYRTVVMFIIMLITMRLLGKRQMGQLELNELVVAIMLSELAVSPITNPGNNRLLYGIVPVVVLLAGELLIAFLCMKSIRIRTLFVGKPSNIIRDGQIIQKEMRRNRLNIDELTEKLRSQGHTDLSTIKHVILEVNGALSVLPFKAHTPATYESHQLQSKDNGLPVLVINDGRILDQNLTAIGLDRRWLEKEIKQRGASDPTKVFLLSVDENQNVYYAPKDAT